jgi:hypothetical protein
MLRGTTSRRHRGRELGCAAWVVVAIAIGLSGCVGERALAIIQNQVPQTGCEIPGQDTDIYRPSGLLDVRGDQGYILFPLMRNDMLPSAGLDGQPERNRVYLRRFEIELEVEDAVGSDVPGQLTNFSVPISAEMVPGQLRSSLVKVIPDLLVPFLVVPEGFRPTVTATVKVVADHHGNEIESPEFVYPIEICDGCLVTVLDACPGTVQDEINFVSNECGIPQDTGVACCNDPSRGFICLAGSGN